MGALRRRWKIINELVRKSMSARLSLVYTPGARWRRWQVEMPAGWEVAGTGTDLGTGHRDVLFEGAHTMQSAARVAILAHVEELKAGDVIDWYRLQEEGV